MSNLISGYDDDLPRESKLDPSSSSTLTEKSQKKIIDSKARTKKKADESQKAQQKVHPKPFPNNNKLPKPSSRQNKPSESNSTEIENSKKRQGQD